MRVRLLLLTVLGAVGLAAGTVSEAEAQGVTWEQLAAKGWTCFPAPPNPAMIVCFDPGRGRPFPGNPDPRPTYSFLAFSRDSGAHIANGHLIRADIYGGQPCGPSGASSYDYRAAIGYYECVQSV